MSRSSAPDDSSGCSQADAASDFGAGFMMEGKVRLVRWCTFSINLNTQGWPGECRMELEDKKKHFEESPLRVSIGCSEA